MDAINQPAGSPVAAIVLSVESLDRERRFYQEVIGLEPSETITLDGAAFRRHWGVAKGVTARAVLLSGRSAVGRVLLLEFAGAGRLRVRRPEERRYYGNFSHVFYTADIAGATRTIAARGYPAWTEPTRHEFGTSVGNVTEVVHDGPAGVPINLVQLDGAPDTVVGRMRRFVEAHGTTPTGFTEVASVALVTRDGPAAVRFYCDALGQTILLDEDLEQPETNRFLCLPATARTHVTYTQGGHDFGKVVVSQPLNYDPPDRTGEAVAPNIGFLAMSFIVASIDSTLAAADVCGASLFSAPERISLPGIGECQAALIRVPGSGALAHLVEAS
jgi:catechol 2,3-dioxygenase-like lactoylglutathione lyase family enzyme